MKKILLLAGFSSLVSLANAQSFNAISLFDDSFSASIGSAPLDLAGATYAVYWGTYAGGVFSPLGGSAYNSDNDGYAGAPFGSIEVFVAGAQANNTAIAAGTQLYLAITTLQYGSDYSVGENEAILTDPSWVAPTFDAFAGGAYEVSFSAQTAAIKGQYSYNGGNELINLSAIPEPSTFAAVAGLAVLGAVAARRRRSA